ncbi:zinc finger protein with KRAB and SCAN domains 1-like isoform X2 [Pieris brassicae]|uniref:zinc finger protein with KRAB and SCAN domains 1-like isoform X2 n=1 Tax=Pieris brassicae TaxID=7116 RepID=UPI001E6603F2|nr:zinc finger protein with KRAB and SCAN domains 1-like isoform X2 [Pieris brassicae]
MALCESQLGSMMQLQDSREGTSSSDKKPKVESNGDIYGLDKVPPLPLSVDYRSPVSHFVPPAVELYAARHKPEINIVAPATPVKRKRGRPRIDKTSPEYLANLAARKQAREMAAVMSVNSNSNSNSQGDSAEKRKRGRPRVDKTSPEYLARKRARELALERKAKKEFRRRNTAAKSKSSLATRVKKTNHSKMGGVRKAGERTPSKVVRKSDVGVRRNAKFIKRKDSAASSSAGESTPRVKRKYTKRTPTKKDGNSSTDRVKGKRGRPRKIDQMNRNPQEGKIRVRNNLMPLNTEPIPVDSDDEPDLGSPSQASDSLSLDENLRALRHIHEKYANIDKMKLLQDDLYEAHLLAANFKKPPVDQVQRLTREDDDVLSVRSSEGGASVKELETRVEKLEDSSNSDSGSSSSGSGSSSSGSSSSSSSDSSSSSSSESEGEEEKGEEKEPTELNSLENTNDERSFGAWSHGQSAQSGTNSDSGSDSDPERGGIPGPIPAQDEISESENESADKSFQCHICKKWYSTRVTLKIHRRGHQSRGGGGRSRARSSDKYECDCCSATFTRKEKLWEHRAEAHRGSMTVRCEVCRKCFEDEAELARHDASHSADERAGRCSVCGAQFPRYEQLRRHASTAHPAPARLPHACAQCGKRFSHAHSLTRHTHNHAKQLYRCVVCKASFARADQLAQHLNSHLANYKRLKR